MLSKDNFSEEEFQNRDFEQLVYSKLQTKEQTEPSPDSLEV